MRTQTAQFIPLCLSLLALACDDPAADEGTPAEDAGPASQTGEAFPTEGWATSTPEEQGMDSAMLEEAFDYAFDTAANTQGMLIVRNGHIVSERYAEGKDADSWASSWSMGKSVSGMIVGIAQGEGLIDSLDVPLADYYPNWAGTDKEPITLRNVLQMSSGLAWVEEYTADGSSNVTEMALSHADQLQYALTATEVGYPAGSRFNYSSGDSMLLSGVLEQAIGGSVKDYAQDKLFGPLGMNAQWWTDAEDHTLTYCCIDTTTRDFAKLGLLLLHGGRWEGEQIIPESHVEATLTGASSWDGYGYQMWLMGNFERSLPRDTFAFIGVDEQHIYVVPSLDLVVVRNSIYHKYDGPTVGDPTLLSRLPSHGLRTDLGTQPAGIMWDHAAFLKPIVDSVQAEAAQGEQP